MIVNAANESLLGGGGVDGAIHKVAGPDLTEYCRKLNGCPTGQAKLTPAFELPSYFVIHTVGPVWHGGNMGEADLLKECYQNSLKIADGQKLKTIAFPAISTGVFGFPAPQAAHIAVCAIKDFFLTPSSINEVTLVAFSDVDLAILQKTISAYKA